MKDTMMQTNTSDTNEIVHPSYGRINMNGQTEVYCFL